MGSGPRWGGGSGLAAAGAAVAPFLSLGDAGLGSCTGCADPGLCGAGVGSGALAGVEAMAGAPAAAFWLECRSSTGLAG
nr:hypothetical protein [Mesorhizobium sp. M4B.F.Ca.ET.017.02.2.1]